MPLSRKQQVWKRARGCCEYCQMSQEFQVRPLQLDHVRAQKHRGKTNTANLALACFECNIYKSSSPAGFDPATEQLYPLFDPRKDSWNRHFRWVGALLKGKTAIGRTTIDVLRINLPTRVQHRKMLMVLGLFPPRVLKRKQTIEDEGLHE